MTCPQNDSKKLPAIFVEGHANPKFDNIPTLSVFRLFFCLLRVWEIIIPLKKRFITEEHLNDEKN